MVLADVVVLAAVDAAVVERDGTRVVGDDDLALSRVDVGGQPSNFVGFEEFVERGAAGTREPEAFAVGPRRVVDGPRLGVVGEGCEARAKRVPRSMSAATRRSRERGEMSFDRVLVGVEDSGGSWRL